MPIKASGPGRTDQPIKVAVEDVVQYAECAVQQCTTHAEANKSTSQVDSRGLE